MIVKSKITKVTVYADRAEITRNIREQAGKGEQLFVFDSLPDGIEENSIQVKGGQGALLKGAKLKKVYFAEYPDSQVKELHDKLKSSSDSLGEIDDRLASCEKERVFLEKISKKLTASPTKKGEPFEYDPKNWTGLVDFYRSRSDALNREIREANRAKASLLAQIEKAERDIQQVESGNRKEKTQIEVSVAMNKDGELDLDLSYMVYGPSWEPVYDLRVASEQKRMKISYHAMVRQNSAESWENVSLKLSTAKPQIGGNQPELNPWRVSFFVPAPREMKRARVADRPASAPAMKQMFASEGEALSEEAESVAEPMEAVASTIETGATAVAFVIDGASTIGCDGEPHRVTILEREFPAVFRYSTVPKLSPYAYLKAKTKNETEYPFLPGASNVFLDGNFVARASFNFVAPGEEFWTFLGIDESLKIVHKFLGRFEMTEGLFSKTTKLMYKFLITAKNNKQAEEELVVWDQLPIPSNEEIVVKLVEPDYKKDTDSLKMNELKYLEWFFKIKFGEEKRIPFTFTVEYPRNSNVSGL